jgi:hypothetical protein
MWDILKDLRLFKYIFKKVKAFVEKCEAFVEIKGEVLGVGGLHF